MVEQTAPIENPRIIYLLHTANIYIKLHITDALLVYEGGIQHVQRTGIFGNALARAIYNSSFNHTQPRCVRLPHGMRRSPI